MSESKKLIGYCFTESDLKRKKHFPIKKDRGNIFYRYDPIESEMYVLVDSTNNLEELEARIKNMGLSIKNKKLVDYHLIA